MTVSLDEGRLAEGRLAALASSFSGSLLRPTDAAYEEVRRVHNGLVDRRPALIARCQGAPDAAAALAFARENALPVSAEVGDTTSPVAR
jgi:hypothetical protein